MDIVKEFVKPELLILIPVLYFVGVLLKNSLIVSDKYIPLVLGITGIVLSVIWVMATTDISNTKDIAMLIFTAITQGILCSGCTVYFNQLFVVQPKKGE